MTHRRTTTCLYSALLLTAASTMAPGCFSVRRESVQNALIDLDRVAEAEESTADTTYRSARLEGAGLASAEPVKRVRVEARSGAADVGVARPERAPAGAGTETSAESGVRVDRQPDTVITVPIDSLIGQISGRPLFATDFFEPMDARMMAEAQRSGDREFLLSLREQITAALRDTIRDELLLAEFEASLSPQQRQGLAAFVAGVRDDLVRQSGGSIELANESLLTEEGLTLDEKVEAESRQQLVRQMVGQLLRNRAYIPWRDVKRAYLRDFDEFRPPPIASLRVIMTPADDAALTAIVQQELAEGTAFAKVAEEHSIVFAESGGLQAVPVAAGGLGETEFFGDPELNTHATGLSVGETIGPIDWNNRRVWLTLESLGGTDITLYEAQEQILNLLRQERLSEVQGEFFQDLQKRGSLSSIDTMEAELFRLGAERYLISRQSQQQ